MGACSTRMFTSRYLVRRSEFSSNTAGEDGGVMFVGRVTSQVSIEDCSFSFNNALVRGGVAALIGTTMTLQLNGTSIFNNTAQFGGVISSCNSGVTGWEMNYSLVEIQCTPSVLCMTDTLSTIKYQLQ